MQSCCRFFVVLFVSIPALASELTVRVIDPQSAAVSGAQVEIFSASSNKAVAVQTTSGQGVAQFRGITAELSRVHVLAPGFA